DLPSMSAPQLQAIHRELFGSEHRVPDVLRLWQLLRVTADVAPPRFLEVSPASLPLRFPEWYCRQPMSALLGKLVRRHGVLPTPAAQGAQKGYQVLLLGGSQTQRLDAPVEIGVWSRAFIVEFDNFLQCGEAAIVHIGRCRRDLTQRRRLEGAEVGGI